MQTDIYPTALTHFGTEIPVMEQAKLFFFFATGVTLRLTETDKDKVFDFISVRYCPQLLLGHNKTLTQTHW